MVSQIGVDNVRVKADKNTPNKYWIKVLPDVDHAELALIRELEDRSAIQVPLFISIPHLRWAFVDPDAGLSDLQTTSMPVRKSVEELLLPEIAPWLRIELTYLGETNLELQLRLLDIESNVLQESRIYEALPGPKRRVYRISLGEFLDTLRANATSSFFRIELLLQGIQGNADQAKVHILTLFQGLDVSDVKLAPLDNENVAWRLTWKEDRILKNRAVRIWPSWRPWEKPVDLRIPSDAEGHRDIHAQDGSFEAGRYLIEFYVDDPWIMDCALPERPDANLPSVWVFDIEDPDTRYIWLVKQLSENPNQFLLHFERACLLFDVHGEDEANDGIDWCYKNFGQASIPCILAFRRWLIASGVSNWAKALEMRMFEVDLLRRLLEEFLRDEVSQTQFYEYLSALPNPELLRTDAALLLLEFGVEKAQIVSSQCLINKGENQGVVHVLQLTQNEQLSKKDAIRLLGLNPELSKDVLVEFPDNPLARCLLQAIDPDQVPEVGYWIRSSVGWGRIESITDSFTNKPLSSFLAGVQKPILEVTLRAGVCNERVRIDLRDSEEIREGNVEFVDAERIHTCGKCHKFSSEDQHAIPRYHDYAAHEGRGARIISESRNTRLTGSIIYDHRQPPSIWA